MFKKKSIKAVRKFLDWFYVFNFWLPIVHNTVSLWDEEKCSQDNSTGEHRTIVHQTVDQNSIVHQTAEHSTIVHQTVDQNAIVHQTAEHSTIVHQT